MTTMHNAHTSSSLSLQKVFWIAVLLLAACATTPSPHDAVAPVSVGIVDGEPRLDLHYDDDVRAETDMNVVMTGGGKYIEIQGTAEGAPFDRELLDQLLALAGAGCADLTAMQAAARA